MLPAPPCSALFLCDKNKKKLRTMQAQQKTHNNKQHGLMTKIFSAQLRKTELFLSGHFPQEIEIDISRDCLCLGNQFAWRRRGKLQQAIKRAHLGALAALQ